MGSQQTKQKRVKKPQTQIGKIRFNDLSLTKKQEWLDKLIRLAKEYALETERDSNLLGEIGELLVAIKCDPQLRLYPSGQPGSDAFLKSEAGGDEVQVKTTHLENNDWDMLTSDQGPKKWGLFLAIQLDNNYKPIACACASKKALAGKSRCSFNQIKKAGVGDARAEALVKLVMA